MTAPQLLAYALLRGAGGILVGVGFLLCAVAWLGSEGR